MPSQSSTALGLKVLTVAPGNPSFGSPRIQGVYVLFEGTTFAPIALADGAAVTSVRTPATSLLAIREWARGRDALAAVIIGAGPQGKSHAEALRAELGTRLQDVAIAVRSPGKTDANWREAHGVREVDFGRQYEYLPNADIVVCATTAATPIFDSALLQDDVLVVAVGSHTPDARELDSALMSRGQIIVEELATACSEAGDVVVPFEAGDLDAANLIRLADLVTGRFTYAHGSPAVFKSVGMSWEDLVIIERSYRLIELEKP